MTLEELRHELRPIADSVYEWAKKAEDDDFAPWVVEALSRAAGLLMLGAKV